MRHLTEILEHLNELTDWQDQRQRLIFNALEAIDHELEGLQAAKKRADDANDVPW